MGTKNGTNRFLFGEQDSETNNFHKKIRLIEIY